MIYLLKKSTFCSKQKIRRVFTTLLMLVLVTGLTFAQKTSIKGKVTDASTGELLPGVSIVIKGTTFGTTSDIDGAYTIEVTGGNPILVFSYIGYVTEEIPAAGKSVIDVKLVPDIQKLDEVVVIGYGTVKKKDLTGSVSSLNSEKIKDIPITSAAEALTGKLAGVQVTSTEGSPDAEIKIRVRGGGSITQDNSPLYIVDGFTVNSINDIAPSDIETIDVLKDASSTAIYGSRGANGVIIVTTKSAKEGKITVNYNGYYGVKKVTKTLDVLEPSDYVSWQYEMAVLRNEVTSKYEKYFGSYSDMDLYDGLEGNNWQKQIFGNLGTTSNNNLAIMGGTEKLQFNFSYNHIEEKTIMLATNFKRDNFNLKLNGEPNKKVNFGFSIRYSNTNVRGSGMNEQDEKSSSDSRLRNVVIYTPIPINNMSLASDDEESFGNLYPPYKAIYDNDRLSQKKNLNLGSNFSYEIIKGLKLRTELGLDNNWNDDDRFYGLTTYYVRNQTTIINKPAVILTNKKENTFRNANTATFEKKNLGAGHSFSLMVGEEYSITKSEEFTNEVQGLPASFDADKAFRLTTQAELPYQIDQYYNPDDILLSYFGRVNYDFLGKILLSATFRADGSSKFGEGNKWGYFPSAAIAYRLSDESFMKSIEWLNNLKFRLSFGSAGNNKIPSGQILKTLDSWNTTFLSTSSNYWSPSKILNNEDLKWETTYTRNLGLDFGFLKNRINGSVELYKNNTKDLLILMPIPGSGYSSQYRNIGETSNRGLEITLNAVILNDKDYSLDCSFNIGFNKNRVEDLGTIKEYNASSGWTSEIPLDYKVITGESVGRMYGYKTDGRYSVDDFTYDGDEWLLNDTNSITPMNKSIDGASWGPGALKLKDLNGDSTINNEDMTFIGNANPIHTGGFTLSGRYKNFDFSAIFNWSYGNDIYNANRIEFTSSSKNSFRNMTDDMAKGKRWTNIDANGNLVTDPETLRSLNANTTMWSPLTSKFVLHSWAVEDGSFLRLSSVTIGYTLPESLMSKFYIKNLRIYATGYNLLCFTNYSGYDPEVDTRRKTPLTPGVDYAAFPRSRSVIFGVNLSF